MTENAPSVLAQLRRLIEGGLAAEDGQLPNERTLAERLGVGRRAVRTALEVLEEEGLIWRRQGKGTFLGQAPDPSGLIAADMVETVDGAAIMEARLCIEPELAALCAERASAEDVARMRRLNEHLRASPDAETAELWDGALHRLIARAAGNPILLTAFQILDELRIRDDWQAMRANARSAEAFAITDREHRLIIDAIAERRPDKARGAMELHLGRLARNLAKSLGKVAE